jgi:RNA recognition motif-containing protein
VLCRHLTSPKHCWEHLCGEGPRCLLLLRMAHSSSRDGNLSLGSRKLVVLGIPWDIDTEGLRQYMLRFGELDDVIVMKDRATGRSRGFGYVTFSSADNAQVCI